jgi:hypothetical protein
MASGKGHVEAVRALAELGAHVNQATVGCVDVTLSARPHVNLKFTVLVCLFVHTGIQLKGCMWNHDALVFGRMRRAVYDSGPS